MSDTEVESVNTMSALAFSDVVANIKDCAKECVENQDYISFSTILDVYLSDWGAYPCDERLELINLLYTVLDENKDLLTEVAWDLPPLLLSFLNCEWPARFSLRDSPQVTAFYKVFNLLAEYGSPKELLLTCCEQLKNLKDPEENNEPISPSVIKDASDAMDEEYKSKFEDLDSLVENYLQTYQQGRVVLNFHGLFECAKCCMERIKTLYPSKFLGIFVSTILNVLANAPNLTDTISVLRSIYLFIRDYVPSDIPDDLQDDESVTPADLEKIFDDESYLQRKLLRLLFDSVVEKLGQGHYFALVNFVTNPTADIYKKPPHYYFIELADRLLTLALSFDIDIPLSFTKEILYCHTLFANNIDKINTSEDIIRLIISAYNSSSFRNKSPKALPVSNTTLIILYGYAKYAENYSYEIPSNVTVLELIETQLMMFIPYSVDSKLTNTTAFAYFLIITIDRIEKTKIIVTKDELSDKKVRLVLLTYLQNVASIACTSNSKGIAALYAKFIKKFLQHLPEDLSYTFILDTLKYCPFDDNILCILNVFKSLISNTNYDDEKLTKDFSNLNVSNDKPTSELPVLPERKNIPVITFIEFTKERQDDFLNIFDEATDSTFIDSDLGIDIMKSNRLIKLMDFIKTTEFIESEKINSRFEKIGAKVALVVKRNQTNKNQGVELVTKLITDTLKANK